MIAYLLMFALAQVPEPCLERYSSLRGQECPSGQCPLSEQEACARLAHAFTADASRLGYLVSQEEGAGEIPRGKLQPSLGASVAGTPIQFSATTPVNPVALAGASLGSVSGARGDLWLLTLSVNPLALSSDSAKDFAHRSRLFDVSLVIPTGLSREVPPDFFGLRANIDFFGAAVARRRFEALSKAAAMALQQALTPGGSLEVTLQGMLSELPPERRQQCLDVLLGPRPTLEKLAAACASGLPAQLRTAALETRPFREALEGFHDATGTSQGGLNVQLDVPASRTNSVPFRAALVGSGMYRLTPGSRSPWQAAAMASLGSDYLLQAGEGALGGTLALSVGLLGRLLPDTPNLHVNVGLRGHLGQELAVQVLSPASQPGNYLQAQVGTSLPLGRSGLSVTGSINRGLAGEGIGLTFFAMGLIYSTPSSL